MPRRNSGDPSLRPKPGDQTESRGRRLPTWTGRRAEAKRGPTPRPRPARRDTPGPSVIGPQPDCTPIPVDAANPALAESGPTEYPARRGRGCGVELELT